MPCSFQSEVHDLTSRANEKATRCQELEAQTQQLLTQHRQQAEEWQLEKQESSELKDRLQLELDAQAAEMKKQADTFTQKVTCVHHSWLYRIVPRVLLKTALWFKLLTQFSQK